MGSEPKAGELVERLTFAARAWHGWDIEDLLREAATLLSSQEAEIAELKNVIENGNWGDRWRKRAEASEAEREQARAALELAKGRLELLLSAELPESDHPSATRYVLKIVYAALDEGSKRDG